MIKNNINCWEHKQCGREINGKNIDSLGICPAASLDKFDAVNNGKNGGRFCWFIEKTTCEIEVVGNFFERFEHCQKCEFYLLVQKQENRHLVVVQNEML